MTNIASGERIGDGLDTLRSAGPISEAAVFTTTTAIAFYAGENLGALPGEAAFQQQQGIDIQIDDAKADKQALQQTQQLLVQSGFTVSTAFNTSVSAEDQHIAELTAAKDALGNQAVNCLEGLAIPVALGIAATALTFKKLRRTKRPELAN